MLAYQYQAISHDGIKVNGVVEAHNEYEAMVQIKENCSIILKIKEISAEGADAKHLGGKVREKSLAMLCSQFAIIIKAGLPIVRAVELIAAQTTDRTLRRILNQVALDVSAGFGLAQSFENNGPHLPTTFIETIRSGEESGTLDEAFRRLHHYYEKSAKLRSKVISALTYPAFTCVVAVIVVTIIMVFAVPSFMNSYASMSIALPWPTRVLIAASTFFSHYILLILALLAAAVIAYILYKKSEQGAMKLSVLHLKLPVLGRLNLMKAASEYANTMATMLAAGLPILRALSITGRAMSNYYIGTELQRVVTDLESGHQLAACLRKIPIFPELLVEMTGVGEETGTLESTLDVIGAYYDNETELVSARVLSLIEPIIICILAVVVVLILLAVYLPMFSLYGGI